MVQYRKGTRSRPQVKIPKQYHDDYEDVIQQPPTPPTETADDPLIPIEIIKTEPIDVVENDISSSFESMEAGFTAEEPPQLTVNPLAVNPLEVQTAEVFTPIKLTTEHLEQEKKAAEDSVAAIQISECHSMNLEEQAEENREIDESFETMMEEVFRGSVEGTLQTSAAEEGAEEEVGDVVNMMANGGETMEVDGREESVVENHVNEVLEEGPPELSVEDGGDEEAV